MNARRPVKAILFLLLILAPMALHPECTSFRLQSRGAVLLCNNLDWYAGDGMLVVNKRGVSKIGCWYGSTPRWTSKYGSVTINQFGREFPSRGMNEAGLAVVEMTLSETRFPGPDKRPALSTLQWMQYQLDCHSRVEEVIASDAEVRIDAGEYHSHFMVADRSGACATIEWLDGKLVSHMGSALPVAVLSNDSYETCLAAWRAKVSRPEYDFSSVARFLRAADWVARYDEKKDGPAPGYSFKILASVGPLNFNQWSLVLDLTNLRFSLRTMTNRNVRYVDFSSCDFSPKTPVKVFPLDNGLSGDVGAFFADYTYPANRALILAMFAKVGVYIGDASPLVKETMARYPDTTKPSE